LDLKKLKSGTDIRGTAVDTEQYGPMELTDEAVKAIARAFLVWREKRVNIPKEGLRVAVGRDSRVSGPRISEALKSAFLPYGAKCFDCGLASTPSMFMAVLNLPCDCAVQITASHHPYYRNGLKFFTKDGGLESEDIDEILELAEAGACPKEREGGAWEQTDHMAVYAKGLRELIIKGAEQSGGGQADQRPLEGLHITVDAGNGAGGFYADQVLLPLGADVTGSQFLQPDGMFPNHVPNPEDKEAMESACRMVKEAGADLGIIFDTDVDRAGVVDSRGREINRNRLVALAAAIALEDAEGGTVVTDSITSDGLREYIEDGLRGRHHRFKRGYKNVINEALRLNAQGEDCPLAIETS